jgi:uncharacterized protein YcsI (UPF0317 family)
MVVSYRPIPKERVQEAINITRTFVDCHGDPVHVGDPSVIGISDLMKPDFGDAVCYQDGDEHCFWACGVTAIMAATSCEEASVVVTHSPGHMFVTDIRDEGLND